MTDSDTDSDLEFENVLDKTHECDVLCDVLSYEFDRSAKCDGYLLGGNSIAYLASDFIKEHGLTVPYLHQHFLNNGEDRYNKFPNRISPVWNRRFPDPWIPKYPRDPFLETLMDWIDRHCDPTEEYSTESIALRTISRYKST